MEKLVTNVNHIQNRILPVIKCVLENWTFLAENDNSENYRYVLTYKDADGNPVDFRVDTDEGLCYFLCDHMDDTDVTAVYETWPKHSGDTLYPVDGPHEFTDRPSYHNFYTNHKRKELLEHVYAYLVAYVYHEVALTKEQQGGYLGNRVVNRGKALLEHWNRIGELGGDVVVQLPSQEVTFFAWCGLCSNLYEYGVPCTLKNYLFENWVGFSGSTQYPVGGEYEYDIDFGRNKFLNPKRRELLEFSLAVMEHLK